MKKLIFIILTFYLVLASQAIAYAVPAIIYVNGERLNLPSEPVLEAGVTLVPVRPIFEALGAKVFWHGSYQEVEAIKGELSIKLPVGKKVGLINGQLHELDVATKVINNHTFVPLRFVSEALGAAVEWDREGNIITVNTKINKDYAGFNQEATLSTTALAKKTQHVVMIMIYDSHEQLIATASGVVVGPDGMIVTNYHVIAGAGKALVVNDNEEVFPVESVLAFDKERDLALLKVDGNLAPALLGDSDLVEKGDSVVTIGSPLGIRNTVSVGVVSNLIEIENLPFIQLSAPISPGSSGGAVFNSRGELIGIITAFAEQGQNISLAIPSNELKGLTDKLLEVPLALNHLGREEQPAKSERLSLEELTNYLNQYHSNYGKEDSPIHFSFFPAEGSLFDYEIEALIEPMHYGNWLELDSEEKLAIVGSIVKGIDAKVELTESFRVSFFYLDHWPFYPSPFLALEISPTPDGTGWLVNHLIAQGYTNGDQLKWEIFD